MLSGLYTFSRLVKNFNFWRNASVKQPLQWGELQIFCPYEDGKISKLLLYTLYFVLLSSAYVFYNFNWNAIVTIGVFFSKLAMYPPHIIPDDDSRISCSQCRIQRHKRRRLERFVVRLKKHIEAKDKEMKSLNKWIDISFVYPWWTEIL